MASRDPVEIWQAAHRLRGGAGALRFDKVAELTLAIELEARQSERLQEDEVALIDALMLSLDDTMAELRSAVDAC